MKSKNSSLAVASQIAEHVSTVRIFVTWDNPNDGQRTMSYDTGRGSWYAQYGHIVEWLEAVNEQTRLHERTKSQNPS